MSLSLPPTENIIAIKRQFFLRDDVNSTSGDYNFITPEGCIGIKCYVWGAGGAGGLHINNTALGSRLCQGGCGGGYSEGFYYLEPKITLNVNVGLGGRQGGYQDGTSVFDGAPGASSFVAKRTSNISGSGTTFRNLIQATGGAGGTFAPSIVVLAPGVGSGGYLNYTGGQGGKNSFFSNKAGTPGGGSAAGPWGNGFSGGDALPSSSSSFSGGAGGGGIGGKGGNGLPTNSSGGGGGGSFSSALLEAAGLGYGTAAQPSATSATSGTDTLLITNYLFDDFFDPLKASGNGAAGSSSITTLLGARGAGGAGGYTTSSTTTSTPPIAGNAGGIFGGGGGAGGMNNVSNTYAYGGQGGLGAGGGSSVSSFSASNGLLAGYYGQYNAGGHGMIIIDFYFGV